MLLESRVLAITLSLLASVSVPHTTTFEISSNKPFIKATVNGSEPQWFILDTGCRETSIIASECADRLGLPRGAEEKAQVGAGAGADVGLSTVGRPLVL